MKRFAAFLMVAGALLFNQPAWTHPQSFADLVEKYSPAVVNISTSSKAEKRAPTTKKMPNFPGEKPFEGTPFEKFFEDLFTQDLMPMQQLPRRSLGSGVVISEDGYIVTNNHVIDGADEIIVRFDAAGEEYEAKLVGRDPKTDVALIKIDADRDLPVAPLGSSAELKVGEWVVAIGNPFNLGGSVTAGIISAMGRNINMGPYDDFIQTDAAINPGNSGGPLFDMDGRVVGINTAIITRSGGSQGIGFATPIDTVKLIVDQIKEHGHPIRGWLGVKIQVVTKDLADALGLEKAEGALVAEVLPDSPAQRAGLKDGDVIISFDGKEVNDMQSLPKIVAETPVGDRVVIELVRQGRRMSLKAKVAEMDEDQELSINVQQKSKNEEKHLGMLLRPLTKSMRQQNGLADDLEGLLVTEVELGSAAYEGGMRSGDIIMQVGRRPVDELDEFRKYVEASDKDSVLLLVHRGDGNLFIAVRKDEAAE